jgi:hypothetical protein
MKSGSQLQSSRYSPVQGDWRAWLPESKARVFQNIEGHIENGYAMFSVMLDEAFLLLREGRIEQARQAVAVSGALSGMLAHPLVAMLRALDAHARHFGTLPHSDPLSPGNFRGERCQQSARMSELLSLVLLTERSHFLHKIRTLIEMTEAAEQDYALSASRLSERTALAPTKTWCTLEELHYDLNTCFRESVVVLKSFLRALPEEELASFEKQACKLPEQPTPPENSSDKIPHGPSASFARK